MTHDEMVWELYKGFAAEGFNAEYFGSFDTDSQQEKSAERYHAMAETFAKTFERLSVEESERTINDTPFERRVPDFKVTAMEG